MFQNLRANDRIETIVFKGQIECVCNCNHTCTIAMIAEFCVVFDPVVGFFNIVKVNIHSHGEQIIELQGGAGVASRPAADIENTAAGLYCKPVKVDGNHESPPGKPQRSFPPPFSR